MILFIPDHDSRYSADDNGGVWSWVGGFRGARTLTPKQMKTPLGPTYKVVNLRLNGKTKLWAVHQLVCWTFHGSKPDGAETIRHLNGKELDNRADNLKWGTWKEQAEDRRLHGTMLFGDTAPRSILTEAQVLQIIIEYQPDAPRKRGHPTPGLPTMKDLGEKYGVSKGAIEQIFQGHNWKHVWEIYNNY